MKKIRISYNKIEQYSEMAYLAVLACYIFVLSMGTTMLHFQFPYHIEWILRILMLVVVLWNFGFVHTYRDKEWMLLMAFLFVCGLSWANTGYDYLIDLALIMAGAYKIHYRKILKVLFWVGLYILIIAIIGSFAGVARDLVYQTERKGEIVVRHSFGMIYTTDFAAKVFYELLMGWILYGKKLPYLFIILDMVGAGLVYYFCGARTSTILLILSSIVCMYVHLTEKRNPKVLAFLEGKLLQIAIPLVGAGMVALTWWYSEENEVAVRIDHLLTDRLSIGKKVWETYGIHLMGTFFLMRGNGAEEDFNWALGYDFLDCSFIAILLQYGSLFLIVFCLLIICSQRKIYKTGMRNVAYAFVLVAVHSIMEQHFLEVIYNGFLVLVFADFSKQDDCKHRIDIRKVILSATILIAGVWAVVPLSYMLRTFVNSIRNQEENIRVYVFVLFISIFIALFLFLIKTILSNNKYYFIRVGVVMGAIGILYGALHLYSVREQESQLAVMNKEAEVIRELLQIEELDGVYVDDLTNVYQKRFPELQKSLFCGNAIISKNQIALITNKDTELNVLMKSDFKYAELSEEHAIYTNNEKVIARLSELGYSTSEYYNTRQYMDLGKLAKLNGTTLTEEEKLRLVGGKQSIEKGLGDTLYPKRWRIEMGVELLKECENNDVALVQVWMENRNALLGEYQITKEDFQENPYTEIQFETKGFWWAVMDVEILIYPVDGVTIEVSDISWEKIG